MRGKRIYQNSRPAKLLSPIRDATEAWWYENTNSIDVFIYTPGKDAVSCRINRQQLKSWLARTEKPEET